MSAPTGGYQGLGFYGGGQTPPPPKKRGNGLVIAVVLAAVVLIGVTTTLLIISPKTVTPGQAMPVANITTKPSGSSSSSSKKGNDPLSPQATGAPMVPGWKVIPINDGDQINSTKAFDVPPAWEPVVGLGNSVILGKDDHTARIYLPVTYMKGYCPGSATSFRSMAGLVLLPNKDDIATQMTTVAKKIADAVYTVDEGTKPTLAMGTQEPVSVNDGKKGYVLTTKATVAQTANKCDGPSGTVTIMLLEPKKEDPNSLFLVAVADQGFPEATAEEDLKKIVTSIHPAN
ncbi:hypothetical protein [Actinocrispum sp. NPDC049592]|uniref:hypothetical protein n=1 Tax=Actinocrispum sp. NPDC049592 TaxID=3154835 RepID=UPI0034204A39